MFSEKAHGASRMEGMNETERRKAIGQFWQINNKLGEIFVVKHFVSLGVSRRMVFSILERFESGETHCETLERKSGSGRKPLKLPQSKQELAAETVVRQYWCITALFGQEIQHQRVFRASCTEESWCEALQAPCRCAIDSDKQKN